MEKRDINTFMKKTHPIRNANLQHLQLAAKSLAHANPSTDPARFLWDYNCAIYSVVKAWKVMNDKGNGKNKPKTGTKPLDGKIGGDNGRSAKTNLSDLRRNENNSQKCQINIETSKEQSVDDERNQRKNHHRNLNNTEGKEDQYHSSS